MIELSNTDDKNLPTPPVNGPEQFSDSDEIGLSEASEVLSENMRRRKRVKAYMIMGILIVAAVIISILIYLVMSDHAPVPGIRVMGPQFRSSIYGSNQPLGVAVSNSGQRIYVTESEGERLVRIYDPFGHQLGTLSPPMQTVPSRSPVYVAIDPLTDNVYVSDRLRAAVDIYSPKGAYRGEFQPSGYSMVGSAPLGLAFDKQGNLYMTDVGGPSHKVLVFGRDRKLLRKIGYRRQFSFPNGVAVDISGNIYVSDSNHGRLAIINSAGQLVASIRRGIGPGDLGLPRGVIIDDRSRLYVVDTTNQNVKVYRLRGQRVPSYIGSFGTEGSQSGAFEYPNGIDVDSSGKIYVTDRENGRVQVWEQ